MVFQPQPAPSLPPKQFGSPVGAAKATGRPSGRASTAASSLRSSSTLTSPQIAAAPAKPATTPKRKQPPTTKFSTGKKPHAFAKSPSRAKASSTPIDTKALRHDPLGTLVRELCRSYDQASSWESFVAKFRGPSCLSSALDNCDHEAASPLRQWRDLGVPAESTSNPWTDQQKDKCIHRGCHCSANQHSDFLREEMARLPARRNGRLQ